MIHTVYSNSYEVLRVCLMNNIEALGVSTGGSGGASLFERAFEKVPVITPNNAVEEDLRRAVADRDGICAGIDFMKLSSWMGFFSKEPMANIVGNEADWMIWDLLRRTGSPRGSGSRAPAPLSRGQERRGRLASGEAHRRGVRRLFDLSSRLGPRLAGHASRDAQRHGRTHDRAEGA